MKKLCLALALLLCLGACGQIIELEAASTIAVTTERETMLRGTLPAQASEDYASIIQAYSELINNKRNGKYDDVEGQEAFEADIRIFTEELGCSMQLAYQINSSCSEAFLLGNPNQLGCAVYDLNKDGVSELIILSEDNCFIYAIFTLDQDEPILLGAYWSRSNCMIDTDGTLYYQGSGGAANGLLKTYILPARGTKLAATAEYAYGTYGYGAEGQTQYYRQEGCIQTMISWEEFSASTKDFPRYPDNPTMRLGLTFMPIR